MADVASEVNVSAPGTAAPSNTARSMVMLLRSVFAEAPARATLVLLVSFALVLTSGVGLLMLVPLLGVAGLDVGGGSVGRIAELVADALAAVGVGLSVPGVLGAYLVIVVGSAALSHLQSTQTALLYQAMIVALRQRVFEGITHARWASYVVHPSSSFTHVLTRETERVGAAIAGVLNLLVKTIMTLVYFGLAVYVSPAATLLVTACGGVLMAMMARKTREGRAKGEAVSRSYEDLFSAIGEHLAGMRVTRGHGVESLHIERFRERTERTARAQADVVRNQADVGFWLNTGSAAVMVGVFAVAFVVLELPLAGLLLLLYLFARMVPALTTLQRQVQDVLGHLPAVERIEAMLKWLSERAEPTGPEDAVPPLTRSLRLEGVSFGYDGGDGGDAVRDVDIEVPAGRTTAIVGPSGGGKSTVADLVVGLLTPDRGRVLVDDVPIEAGRLAAWRRLIGYVSQDTFLFHDTIRANLLLVRGEATDAELREALVDASALFVDALPRGLDTVVGDRGVRLSGGERQRIALARAILRRPALLVLDEATSALDAENERVIQEAIARMAGRQTLLLITHRLASVRSADHIYVLEGGRVVESGRWVDLMSRPQGRLRDLCEAQGLTVA
jgi:ATP-binding cassette, subfamily C, bacterial